MLYNSILEAIGRTPLVRLHRVTAHLECNVFAKCEFLNPGGSVKDRIGYQMVMDAEKAGRIRPGDTLIEPTSGNTGIGIALAGAVRGYRVIITLPEKMSREKQVVLEALGAEIIRTPTEAAWDSPDSHIGVARRLQKELPNAHILDQYSNPSNPKVHYECTGKEILDDLKGQVDMVVMGAGTGGTITGVAKRIKEANPKAIIVGADPVGSILAGPEPIKSYKVEGIGYDFIPDVLDRKLVDEWIKTDDRQSFQLARRLISEEGLLCGGSSGSAMFACLKAATKLKKGQNCVVLLADGVRNYMTKFVDNKWMEENHFSGSTLLQGEVRRMLETRGSRDLVTIDVDDSADRAIQIMRDRGISQLPVLNEGRIVGILTETNLLRQYTSALKPINGAAVGTFMSRNVPLVDAETSLAALQSLVEREGKAVVIDGDKKPIQILTKIDLVEWIASQCEA